MEAALDIFLLPFALITSLHSIVLLTLATTIIESGEGHGGKFLHSLPKTLLALLRNPLLLAILAGFAMRFLGWRSPVVVDGFLALLSGAAAPCSLFALGATLAGFHLGGAIQEDGVPDDLKLRLPTVLGW